MTLTFEETEIAPPPEAPPAPPEALPSANPEAPVNLGLIAMLHGITLLGSGSTAAFRFAVSTLGTDTFQGTSATGPITSFGVFLGTASAGMTVGGVTVTERASVSESATTTLTVTPAGSVGALGTGNMVFAGTGTATASGGTISSSGTGAINFGGTGTATFVGGGVTVLKPAVGFIPIA